MDATIKELRDIASSINSIANWLTEAFSGNGEAEPETTTETAPETTEEPAAEEPAAEEETPAEEPAADADPAIFAAMLN